MNITGKNLTDQGWQIEPRFRHSPPVWHKGNLRYNAGQVWRKGCEEIGNQDEGEEMRVKGRIVFEENVMHRLVRQIWNPSLISLEDRKQIADVLTEIADHLRNDEFEVNGEYKKFPTNWTQE